MHRLVILGILGAVVLSSIIIVVALPMYSTDGTYKIKLEDARIVTKQPNCNSWFFGDTCYETHITNGCPIGFHYTHIPVDGYNATCARDSSPNGPRMIWFYILIPDEGVLKDPYFPDRYTNLPFEGADEFFVDHIDIANSSPSNATITIYASTTFNWKIHYDSNPSVKLFDPNNTEMANLELKMVDLSKVNESIGLPFLVNYTFSQNSQTGIWRAEIIQDEFIASGYEPVDQIIRKLGASPSKTQSFTVVNSDLTP